VFRGSYIVFRGIYRVSEVKYIVYIAFRGVYTVQYIDCLEGVFSMNL